MKKLLFFLSLTISLHAEYINLEEWKRLLYIKNNQNMVVSNNFYISNNNTATAEFELEQTINYLKSDIGMDVACAFPARYTYLKSINIELPDYNLNECKELNEFVSGFQKDHVSLVFTSEYTNVPSSAFGHIMIIFHDENQSYSTADTIHFAALTPQDSFFKYSYSGLTGKYYGYFIREPFFKKAYEYNTIEQRYMHIYTLDYTKEEILLLIYHLHELKKATFKYYFADGNCASYISDFLSITSKNKIDTSYYYLPIDTVKEYSDKIIGKNKYIPLVNKIHLLFSKMTKSQQEDFLNIIRKHSSPSNDIDDIVKESLVDYYTFFFRKFHISYKNYDDIINLTYNKTNIIDSSEEPLNKIQPSNFKFFYKYTNKNSNILIGYRPFYIDINDIQYNQIQESEFTFLDFNILIYNKDIKLDMLNFLSIKSFNINTEFYSPLSWQFYSGLNKKNYKNELKFNNEAGVGFTKQLFKNINLGTLFNVGIDDFEFYIKPSVYIFCYPLKDNKIKIESNYKKYFNEYYYENDISYIVRMNKYIFSISYDNSKIENGVTMAIKYNF